MKYVSCVPRAYEGSSMQFIPESWQISHPIFNYIPSTLHAVVRGGREESSLAPTQGIRELADKRNRWSTSWRTRCHLYLHTHYLFHCFCCSGCTGELVMGNDSRLCDAWSCCLGFSPACWRPGKETAREEGQTKDKQKVLLELHPSVCHSSSSTVQVMLQMKPSVAIIRNPTWVSPRSQKQ